MLREQLKDMKEQLKDMKEREERQIKEMREMREGNENLKAELATLNGLLRETLKQNMNPNKKEEEPQRAGYHLVKKGDPKDEKPQTARDIQAGTIHHVPVGPSQSGGDGYQSGHGGGSI